MSTELRPMKPRIIKPLKIASWKDLFVDLTKALVFGTAAVLSGTLKDKAFESWANLAKDAGFETPEEERAWTLVSRSLFKAILALEERKPELFTPPPEEERPSDKELRERIETSMGEAEFTIGPDFFRYPLGGDMRTFITKWLETCMAMDKSAVAAVVRRLPLYFTGALNDEWRKKPDAYQPLLAYFRSPFFQAEASEYEWLLYSMLLIDQADEAVFGGDLSLSQLYIPLNASYLPPSKDDTEPETRDFRTSRRVQPGDKSEQPIVVTLREHLLSWLDRNDPDDAVRIISGGPGSGKSSFAKIFAADLAASERKVLFIPLHRIDIGGDVPAAVGRYLKNDFRDSLLDDRDTEVLIIFDGLDELTEVGSVYKEAANDFVKKVERQIIYPNKGRIRVLFTGRVVVVQSVQGMFKREQVLTLLPFYLPEDERKKYVGKKELLSFDKRDLWWRKYGALTGHPHMGIPQAFKEGRLGELTAQPLLNYLVALAFAGGEADAAQTNNLNKIYERLINRMYLRDWEQKGQLSFIRNMTKDDYLLVLEAIAVAAWHGSGRTVTVEEIADHCKNSEFTVQWEAFNEDAKRGAANMLTTFYFKQVEARHARHTAFEFTHKSFREYLTVRRMVRLLGYMQELFEVKLIKTPEELALNCWRNLCALAPMDDDLYQFLKDEMQVQPPEEVAKWQKMLCRLIEYVVNEGLPPAEPRPKFKEEDRQSSNAGIALLAAHSACAWVTGAVVPIEWGEKTAAGEWLMRLRGQSEESVLPVVIPSSQTILGLKVGLAFVYKCLNHFDFHELDLSMFDLSFADLSNANLSKVQLYSISFNPAFNLIQKGSSLTCTKLIHANLSGTSLFGLDIRASDLNCANLTCTSLNGAKLCFSNLKGADLTSADLAGANFSHANFTGAILDNKTRAYIEIWNQEHPDTPALL